jgi:hypothetical protein
MKNKNKIFSVLFLLVFCLFSCQNNESSDNPKESGKQNKALKVSPNWLNVGEVVDDKPILIGDKTALLASWNESLFNLSQIKGNFTDVYIDGVEGDYQLIFKGAKYQSSFYVVQLEGNRVLAAIGDTSCTTTECSSENRGCVVKYDQGEPGYCSPCANGGACTKTTSNKSMISFNKEKTGV